MQIESIKITKEELLTAVREFLKVRGLNVEVTSVETYGYPVKGYTVEVDVEGPQLSPTFETIDNELRPPNPAVL